MYKSSLFAFIILLNQSDAKNAYSVYSDNVDSIKRSNVSVHENWVFSRGSAKILLSSSASRIAATNKASYAAKIAFLDSLIRSEFIFCDLSLPKPLYEKFFVQVRHFYLENSFDLSGVQQVASTLDKTHAHVILAIPKEKYHLAYNLSRDDIIRKIVTESISHKHDCDPYLVLELDMGRTPLDILTKFIIRHLSQKYKIPDFQAVTNYTAITSIPDGFLVDHLLEDRRFLDMSWDEKIDQIQFFFCHPQFFFILADEMEKNTMLYSSRVFFNIGTKLPDYKGFATRCKSANHSEETLKFHRTNYLLDSLLPTQKSNILPDNIDYKTYEKLLRSRGVLLVKQTEVENLDYNHAVDCFNANPPLLKEALTYLKKSLDIGITANSCNYLGRCLILSSQPELAISFFTQATQIDHKHPHAAANLAICLQLLGEDKLALKVADKAISDGNLDGWSLLELEKHGLRQRGIQP
jgi:hypothetical protein